MNKQNRKIVHSWNNDYPVFTSKLNTAGDLWVLTKMMWDGNHNPELIKLNRNAKVMDRIQLKNIRHDFDITDKSLFLIQYSLSPQETNKSKNPLKSDSILELDLETHQIKWTLNLQEMPELKPLLQKLNAQQIKSHDITHVNSVRYISKNPLNQKPALLLSVRNISRVILVDYETKKLIWISPENLFEFQHDARLLTNGDLMVFNNRRLSAYSSIDQIQLPQSDVVWSFKSKTENEFHNAILGSAQRLSNGNTLITNGMLGHVFEITSAGEIVWEYLQQLEVRPTHTVWPLAPLFRVEQIDDTILSTMGLEEQCRAS
ncbi:MAG: aryl-sulfate sulfotransferase [Bdellovibrionaceae bacterium]|nr:aryl-sulfate sulfotransferase [Pseudobdellovibrionaceae bacterium]